MVVDVSNSPSFEDAAALEFFETSTRNVLAAEADAGVGHHVAPEQFYLDELIRRGLSVRNDPREVIADPNARYFGAQLSERTLVPGDDARLAHIRFEEWLRQPTPV